eukprot:841962-Amphidinium_carterae.1
MQKPGQGHEQCIANEYAQLTMAGQLKLGQSKLPKSGHWSSKNWTDGWLHPLSFICKDSNMPTSRGSITSWLCSSVSQPQSRQPHQTG